jgi:hypothetical protein
MRVGGVQRVVAAARKGMVCGEGGTFQEAYLFKFLCHGGQILLHFCQLCLQGIHLRHVKVKNPHIRVNTGGKGGGGGLVPGEQ